MALPKQAEACGRMGHEARRTQAQRQQQSAHQVRGMQTADGRIFPVTASAASRQRPETGGQTSGHHVRSGESMHGREFKTEPFLQ